MIFAVSFLGSIHSLKDKFHEGTFRTEVGCFHYFAYLGWTADLARADQVSDMSNLHHHTTLRPRSLAGISAFKSKLDFPVKILSGRLPGRSLSVCSLRHI